MRTAQGYGLLLLLLVSGFGAGWSHGQGYPTKAIRIQTTGAGGGADLAARLVAPEMSASFGQPVVIENHPNTATLAPGVAKAAPDGHTLLIWGGALWLAPLFEQAPYDPVRDFAPITTLTRSPAILVVHPSLPVKSVKELIALAKARPGELNYSAGPTGSSSQIAGELLKSMANVNFVVVIYKGGSQVTTDLLSGQVQMTIGQAASMAPEVKAGRLRVLATAGPRRSSLFPDLPTVAETLPGFVSESLFGAFAPVKTPEAVVRRLNQEIVRVLSLPEIKEKFLNAGKEVIPSSPEQFAATIRSEMAKMGKVIKDAGLRGE